MVDKPKTYAQQNQELKALLEQKDEQIKQLLEQDFESPLLKTRVVELEAIVDQYKQSAHQNTSTNKAVMNDLEQRAISSEQGLRNAQHKIQELEQVKAQLESQVNVFAMEADKTVGKDKKLTGLEETIKSLNFQVLQLQTRIRDLEQQRTVVEDTLQKKVSYYWNLYTSVANELTNIKERIRNNPDPFADLR